MKLIFMGTPEFAVPSLDAVIAAGHTVAAVFTQPDKPKGRKLEMCPPPVKARALQLGLTVHQPVTLKDESVQELIESIKADCIVVVAYGKILPKRTLEAAPHGCVNVHSSLLPKYRGAAPIQWAVINGDEVSGVSTMKLDEGVDTGDILLTCETQVGENETAGELHDRLAQMGAQLLAETLAGLEAGSIIPVKQDEAMASKAPMLDKSLSKLDWSKSAAEIHNLIRGLHPWPCAVACVNGMKLKLHASRLTDGSGKPGEVISLEPLTVACGSGAVALLELQGEGGRRMKTDVFLRGHHIELGAVFE